MYADTLTLLFEALGRCLETNQPAVETYYGGLVCVVGDGGVCAHVCAGPDWMPLLISELQVTLWRVWPFTGSSPSGRV